LSRIDALRSEVSTLDAGTQAARALSNLNERSSTLQSLTDELPVIADQLDEADESHERRLSAAHDGRSIGGAER